jgi:chitinase
MKTILMLSILLSLTTFAAADYRIIGYITDRVEIDRIDANKLTHVNYAFAHVNDKGEMYFKKPDESEAHLAKLNALKQKNPKLKVIVSVGGWGSDGFSDAALTDESRLKFARSGVELVKKHDLDGIDLDWEYPGQAGPGIKFRPEDKQNFTLMLKACREQLDSLSDQKGRRGDERYVLTIASAAGPYFEHTEMDLLHRHLDWINIMAYDFYAPKKTIGHHSGLYKTPGAPAGGHFTDMSVQQHLSAGIPPKKLVVGVPFYGRAFLAQDATENPLNTPYQKQIDAYSYADLVRDYIDKDGYQRRWDAAAKAPYLWNVEKKVFITYDDPQSLAEKTAYINKHRLGGAMYWEHAHDPEEVLLGVLNEGLGKSE